MRHLAACFCFLVLFFACATDEENLHFRPQCGPPIRIVDALVEIQTDDYRLLDLQVNDRCMLVRIAATGCSAADFSMDLVTRGEMAESDPTRTSARLIFDDGKDEEDVTCQTEQERAFSFDLAPYLTDGSLPSEFTLIGLDTTLLIE